VLERTDRSCGMEPGRAADGTVLGVPTEIVGLIRINDHCLFTWRGPAPEHRRKGVPDRAVEVTDDHCQLCIEEAVTRLGFAVVDLRRKRHA
jgi:hypothetical protein